MNRKTIIIASCIVVLIVAIGVFFLASNLTKKQSAQPVAQQDQIIPTLSPEEIGLTLSLIKSGKFANNGVEMKVSKLNDLSSIDYELSYVSKGDIPRGAIGHSDVKPTDTFITQQLPFGTCSDVCHFDQDVKDVKVTLKVTKKDGSVYQVESPFSL